MLARESAETAVEARSQVKTKMTVVRIAVARFEFTPSTPTLARIAVAPAKTADSSDQTSQLFRIFKRSRFLDFLLRPVVDDLDVFHRHEPASEHFIENRQEAVDFLRFIHDLDDDRQVHRKLENF